METREVLAGISIFLLCILFSCSQNKKSDLISIKEGERVFAKNCRSCHGINSDYSIAKMELESFFDSIFINSRKNKIVMHELIRSKISKEEKIRIINYIKFAKKDSVKI
jgi:Zn-finger protein